MVILTVDQQDQTIILFKEVQITIQFKGLHQPEEIHLIISHLLLWGIIPLNAPHHLIEAQIQYIEWIRTKLALKITTTLQIILEGKTLLIMLEPKIIPTKLVGRIIQAIIHTIQEVLEMIILRRAEAQIQQVEVVHHNHLLQDLPHQEAVQEEAIKNFEV